MATMEFVLRLLKEARFQVELDPAGCDETLARVILLFESNKGWFDKQTAAKAPEGDDDLGRKLEQTTRLLDATIAERDVLRRELADMRMTFAEAVEAVAQSAEGEKTRIQDAKVTGKIIHEQDIIIADLRGELEKARRAPHLSLDTVQPLSEHLSNRFQGHPRFFELIERMVVIHEAKNRDYTGGDDYFRNFIACEVWGGDPFTGIMHKLTDKWSRVCTLIREDRIDSPEVTDESIENTFIDAANYYLIAQIMLERRRNAEAADGDLAIISTVPYQGNR